MKLLSCVLDAIHFSQIPCHTFTYLTVWKQRNLTLNTQKLSQSVDNCFQENTDSIAMG